MLLSRASTQRDSRRASRRNGKAEGRATLLVGGAVLREIRVFATRAGAYETGGPLFGTVERTWDKGRFRPLVSVLGTLPPGPALKSAPASVGMGSSGDGERAASALRWLREVTGIDLVHVGDWHLHPRGCPEPSEGDRRTAQEMKALSGSPVWLVAVGVIHRRAEEDLSTSESVVSMLARHEIQHELRFYETNREDGLVPIDVAIPITALPVLPPLPWHVADPARFAAECRLLQAAGFEVGVRAASSVSEPEVELVVRRDSGRTLVLKTGLGYPEEPPEIHDESARRLLTCSSWSATRYLVDAVVEVA